jgi:hypothetical protein
MRKNLTSAVQTVKLFIFVIARSTEMAGIMKKIIKETRGEGNILARDGG